MIVNGWPFTEGPSEGENDKKGAESALLSLESAENPQKEAQKEKKLVRKGQKWREKSEKMVIKTWKCGFQY